MRTELLRFNGAVERDPAIDAWMKERAGGLGAVVHQWFEVIRKCGDEVRELCTTAVRLHVWEMRPSAMSMYSLRTSMWGSFTAHSCRIRRACCKASAGSCAM